MKVSHHLLALAAAAAFALPAQAIVVTGSTTGAPTWTRPLAGTPPAGVSSVGVGVNYTVLPFTVSAAGSYVFQSTSTSFTTGTTTLWDNFTVLYSGAFTPATPLVNAIVANDDNTSIGLSGFTATLATGVNYFFVTTGFAPTNFGTYSNSITGPGNVNVTAVPEPGTYGLMALGMLAVAGAARRRRAG